MDKNKTTIFLIPEEAQQFLLFQQYYNQFMILVNKGVFNQKNAAITLHFDKDGVLQTIQRADFMYSLRHELSTTTQEKG